MLKDAGYDTLDRTDAQRLRTVLAYKYTFAAIEERWGIRISQIGVTADGDTGGAIKRGSSISVVIGDLRLEHIVAK